MNLNVNIKTASILIGLLFYISSMCGQGRNVWGGPETPEHIYVGSLFVDQSVGTNREKIKVEVFGASYGSTSLSTTTYTIGSRAGCIIENRGGEPANFRLKIYKNKDKFDVVVESFGWSAFIVKAWILDAAPIAHEVKCTNYDPTGKEDATSMFTNKYIFTTSHSGDIGIGVKSPKAKLDVNGVVRAKEVKIEATGWSDFVFDKDYKLPCLSEVKSYIEENNHLPDIPSEKEVIENGIEVGEMQKKLLQKIEELTLYVIELKEESAKQQEKIDHLEKTIK